MISSSAGVVITGGMFNNISQSKKGIDLLMDWVATDAFHNSKELYDAPKCHPHTRLAVLADIMEWVIESEVQDEFIMWLFGAAGAGKSAIAKKIAELAAENGILIGSFFFSRTSPTRSTQDRLVATLAYQMTLSIPSTRTQIEDTIERDPAIFHKDIKTQIDALLIKPFQSTSIRTIPIPKLIIIDGLDECSGSKAQVAILDTISRSFTMHNLSIRFLIASRPEIDLVTSFSSKKPLKSIHRRLALDNHYLPDDDIRLFFSDKFEEIQCTHRLGSTLPIPWPTDDLLDALVRKSSGQFIFAATVVRFVESNRHHDRPAERLNIILGISSPGTTNPFAELDALYKHILSSVDDISLTLRVLSLYASSPNLGIYLGRRSEQFLSLEKGDMDRALIGLSSIVSYVESSGEVNILHASLVDFLFDKCRSDQYYIDMASARTDFTCRTFQYVSKEAEGISRRDAYIFVAAFEGAGWILTDQLKREILNFDLDAFIWGEDKSPYSSPHAIIYTFACWIHDVVLRMGLEDADEQLLIRRYRNSFESRIQIYQSDRQLQLLLTLSTVSRIYMHPEVPLHRILDILLEFDDDHLRLVDQNALYLRQTCIHFPYHPDLNDITSRYVDGDSCAFAALHCMRFFSNPPNYSETGNKVSPETSITYAEWKVTCGMGHWWLCILLHWANTSPELIQFMDDHDINTMVQKELPDSDRWYLDSHILAFLGRGGVCVNWRIISAIERALFKNDMSGQSESIEENNSDITYESSGETDSDIYESADEGSDTLLFVADLIP